MRYKRIRATEVFIRLSPRNINSTSTSVRVTTELHEKHAHAYQVIAVFAFEPVDTIYSDSNPLDSALQD